ncbi:ABC transporter substrate-binding protein [Streptomyces sp. AD681]|uniref:ABC transporter substrate-binding protein n=1 Tax=Streptomyces sp. AD681 TaxID=3019069 RepID=UPI0022F1BAD2|nr:ABC transporter substrate-binding protein [Streptomyces sp. AD681]MDA5147042.1 ABC transporter substrate-binding protein [Streptomyces sp. AD681]
MRAPRTPRASRARTVLRDLRATRAATLSGLAALLAATLTACALPTTTGGSAPGSARLTADLAGYPSSLDPGLQYDTASYSVYRNIFDQLLHRNRDTNEPVPWLATHWRRTNPTTWVFTLRDDVRFSDGSRLTAKDAAFSIQRILDPKFGSQQNANFSAIASATGSGHTLTIRTKYPSPTLLTYLTTLSVVPEAYVKKVGDDRFNQRPMGSGPYKFASSIPGSQVVLERNDSYWGKRPPIRDVTFRAVPSAASRVADLTSGKADIADAMTPDTAIQMKGVSNLKVLSAPTERVSYLAFNTLNGGPTEDARVRRAISLAIDYKALIEALEQGYGKRVGGVLTPLAIGYPKQLRPYSYDPDEARRLVEEAGAEGKSVVMATSPAFDPQIVQVIQANIQDVGLKVEIRNSDQATYLKKVQGPAHDWGSIRFGQWSCSCLDADGVIYPLFRSGTVWSSYENPAFDKLVDRARRTIDPAARDRLYSEAYKILGEDTPGIGLFQVYSIYGANKRLVWEPDAQQSFYVADMRFAS